MNGHHNGGRSILVLYTIANSDSDNADPLYNCFSMPRGSGPTLSAVKRNCAAAHALSHLGPEGYHWRVLVEDKVGAGAADKTFSWWDIQDGNAKLPVKESTQYELRKLLYPSRPAETATDSAAKAAKGAFKMMNKMANAVVGEEENLGPPVAVLTFKLLDLNKIQDDMAKKYGGQAPPAPRPTAAKPRPAPKARSRAQPAPRAAASAPARGAAPPRAQGQRQPQQQRRAPQQQQEASLLNFGDSPATNPKTLRHTTSAPPAPTATRAPPPPANETRAQRLKREQEQRMKSQDREWDPIDQRWVEKGSLGGEKPAAPAAAAAKPVAKVKAVKLDGSGAVGKSASVQAGVSKRVNEMREAQEKAKKELRDREAKKVQSENEEDEVRKRLEPKIKVWSEEHGKKKQIRALLATLHTVLWPGTRWKQMSIGDLLDDKKVDKAFKRASLVVHPDKTHDLPAEQRFLAKRIFDALCQAKKEFDNGTK